MSERSSNLVDDFSENLKVKANDTTKVEINSQIAGNLDSQMKTENLSVNTGKIDIAILNSTSPKNTVVEVTKPRRNSVYLESRSILEDSSLSSNSRVLRLFTLSGFIMI